MIYNPFAGGLRGARIERVQRAAAALGGSGARVKLHHTTGPRTAGSIASACVVAGSDLIVAAGGDGTINEVVDGMVGSAVPMGILPAGTANVLANELGLHTGMERTARRLLECEPKRVAVGRIAFADGSAHHFLLMAGAGLDASIVFNLNPAMKARFGKAAYWMGGFSQFGRNLEQFRVIANGREHECSFALISRVRNYGGDFEIAQEVSLLDSDFEVVLFQGSHLFRYFPYFAAVAARRLRGMNGVEIYRASDVRLLPKDGERVHLQVDGEYAGLLPAQVFTVPDAITLMVPANYPRQ